MREPQANMKTLEGSRFLKEGGDYFGDRKSEINDKGSAF